MNYLNTIVSKARPALLLLCLLILAPAAQAQESWQTKLDPEVRTLANLSLRAGKQAPADAVLKRFRGMDVHVDDGQLTADLLVKIEGPETLAELAAAGFEIRVVAGDIAVGRIPVAELPALAQMNAVRKVSISRERRAFNDAARSDTGVDDVHAGMGLPQGYRGDGVIVGVFDSGIDVTHPDFSDDDGTRLLYLLELTPGEGEIEWSKADIDADPTSVTQIDADGHGTHVAGTAAGNGRGDITYMGVAPEADLIVIKGDRAGTEGGGGFSDDDIIAGVAYVFEKASELGQPAVVNLSLGGHEGPHDGSSLVEQAMDNLTGPGRIIVAAAGNEGSDAIHATFESGEDEVHEVLLDAPEHEQTGALAWYDEGALSHVTIGALYIEGGTPYDMGQVDPVAIGESTGDDYLPFVVVEDTIAFYKIDAITTRDSENGDGTLQIEIVTNEEAEVTVYDFAWRLIFTGAASGRVDLWTDSSVGSFLTTDLSLENVVFGDSEYTVGNPASAKKVISVAAYVTKSEWIDMDGNPQMKEGPEGGPQVAGTLAAFSSLGPTRDGRAGVDIAAPGDLTFSANSSSALEAPEFRMIGTGQYIGFEGTSMASPHVAGTVALLLQANPTLDYEGVLELLQSTARTDDFTGDGLPNTAFGAGKLDAFAAVQAAVVSTGREYDDVLPSTLTLEPNYPNPFNPVTSLTFDLPAAGHVTVVVHDVLGREVARLVDGALQAGPHRVAFDAHHLSSGVYVYSVKAGAEQRSRTMTLLK